MAAQKQTKGAQAPNHSPAVALAAALGTSAPAGTVQAPSTQPPTKPVHAPVPLTIAGNTVLSTKHQAAILAAKHAGTIAPALAGALVLGPVAYKVRSGPNAAMWAAIQAALAAGPQPGAALAQAASTAVGKPLGAAFVAYAAAPRNGWLAPAKA